MEQLNLPYSEALNFLFSIRNAYLKGKLIHPEYLTFYVSAKVFLLFLESFKYGGYRYYTDWEGPIRYMLRGVMIKEDRFLKGLEARVVEGKRDWET